MTAGMMLGTTVVTMMMSDQDDDDYGDSDVHLPEERHGPQEPGEHVSHLRAEAGGRGLELPWLAGARV